MNCFFLLSLLFDFGIIQSIYEAAAIVDFILSQNCFQCRKRLSAAMHLIKNQIDVKISSWTVPIVRLSPQIWTEWWRKELKWTGTAVVNVTFPIHTFGFVRCVNISSSASILYGDNNIANKNNNNCDDRPSALSPCTLAVLNICAEQSFGDK